MIPALRVDLGPGVLAAFTSAAEGNLAQHVGDDPQQVMRRRQALADWVAAPVVFGRQVHGRNAVRVDRASLGEPARDDVAACSTAPATPDMQGAAEGCDALVTAGPGVGLGVLVADCVPVLLADPEAGVVGVAHAGRVGLLAGVLDAALAAMAAAGARTERIRVALGPSAGPCCYEVPEPMAREATASLPVLAARTTWGTTSLDLRAGCRSVLIGAGVASVDLAGGCTIEDEQWFSHRRAQGASTGRFAGVVRLIG